MYISFHKILLTMCYLIVSESVSFVLASNINNGTFLHGNKGTRKRKNFSDMAIWL